VQGLYCCCVPAAASYAKGRAGYLTSAVPHVYLRWSHSRRCFSCMAFMYLSLYSLKRRIFVCARAMAPGLQLTWALASFCSANKRSRLCLPPQAASRSANSTPSSDSNMSRVSGTAGGCAPMISFTVIRPNTFLSISNKDVMAWPYKRRYSRFCHCLLPPISGWPDSSVGSGERRRRRPTVGVTGYPLINT